MVLEMPVEFSTISPENKFMGRKNKTVPISKKERKKARIDRFKM